MDEERKLLNGWSPIEGAPKDGTGVLIICMGADRPSAGLGWFINGVWTTLDPDGTADFGDDFFYASSVWQDPTHWRPLPEPPSTRSGGTSDE